MDIREVKIEEYWPAIVKGTVEFGQIAVAENPEFNLLAERIYNALNDAFITTASPDAVSHWENMLGLAVTADMSLEDRKSAILYHLSVKRPYTWRVLKQLIEGVVGAGNFELNLDNDTQTLHILLALEVESKLENVKDLVERVVPEDLDVCYYIAPLPKGYTELEYLESSGTQYIDTLYAPNNETGMLVNYKANVRRDYMVIGVQDVIDGVTCTIYPIRYDGTGHNVMCWGAQGFYGYGTETRAYHRWESTLNWCNDRLTTITSLDDGHRVQDNLSKFGMPARTGVIPQYNRSLWFFGRNNQGKFAYALIGRIYFVKISQGSYIVRDWIPVLDSQGVPCMWDKITRTPYYNSGTGTFGYALKENVVAASGVYARLINGELDVIADTEDPTTAAMPTDLDDEVTPFMHFADVGEAMEYYNIKEEGIENE